MSSASGGERERPPIEIRGIAKAIKHAAERERVDRVIRNKGLADLAAAAPYIGRGTIKNGWARPACCGLDSIDQEGN